MTPTGSGPLRGELWEFDLDPRRGREQRGVRPCLVVSSDAMNRSRFETVIVCPVTTRERPAFAWRPAVSPEDLRIAEPGWEARPHWIMTDQIVTLDSRRRAKRHLATVASAARMSEVDDSLRSMLGVRT